MDPLEFLQQWYASQCDGDWEHDDGISLDTLDNPGWKLEISLQGTALHGIVAGSDMIERSEHDWLHTRSDGSNFFAACGPLNLDEALAAFRSFVYAHSHER